MYPENHIGLNQNTGYGDSSSIIIVLLIMLFVYVLPTIVAIKRGVPNAFFIFIANLTLGFTGIGWLILLLHSLNARTYDRNHREYY